MHAVLPGYVALGLREALFAQYLLTAGLCRTRKWNLPAGKHEYGRMTLEGTSKNLRSLDT